MRQNFYITTTLPYVNSDPHVGFALEIIRADVLARYHRLVGDEVFFNTGTDEHGQKIYQKALEENRKPQEYVDEYAAKFNRLKEALNLSYDNFIRTTDEHHIKAAQKFWEMVSQNGYIYKKNYKVKYCIGCELEKTDSDLQDGLCPDHPSKELEVREEENYFFKFSKFEDRLFKLYESKPDFVIPANRQKEIKNFVKSGLKDFSISRLKEKMPWGVPVPGDETQIMYVWFEALINYISALGWPENKDNFSKWWPGTQIAGKDNLRQQSAMWQAMLMAAELPTSKQILINGFIVSGGQKMSKSLGNVIDPFGYTEGYGTDALRYFLLSNISPFEDGDFTKERFESAYTSSLVNGLGNLVARVAGMSEGIKIDSGQARMIKGGVMTEKAGKAIERFEFDKALEVIWDKIREADKLINEKEVWKLKGEEKVKMLTDLVNVIVQIGVDLQPFLPETSEIILEQFTTEKIVRGKNLFERLPQ
jgi:methionyl-tRNA synthetase